MLNDAVVGTLSDGQQRRRQPEASRLSWCPWSHRTGAVVESDEHAEPLTSFASGRWVLSTDSLRTGARIMGDDLLLADVIKALRRELTEALDAGTDSRLRFKVSDIDLELTVTVKRDLKADSRVRFWVLDGGAAASTGREQVQKLHLRLSPADLAADTTLPRSGISTDLYVDGAVQAGE